MVLPITKTIRETNRQLASFRAVAIAALVIFGILATVFLIWLFTKGKKR